jgi:hypothetical protein
LFQVSSPGDSREPSRRKNKKGEILADLSLFLKRQEELFLLLDGLLGGGLLGRLLFSGCH